MAGLSQEMVCEWAVNCQREVHFELRRMGRLTFSRGSGEFGYLSLTETSKMFSKVVSVKRAL